MSSESDFSPKKPYVMDTKAAASLHSELLEVFRSGRTKKMEWRVSQLAAIARMTEENEKELLDCLTKDLGKPSVEAWPAEVVGTADVARVAIKNLKKWAKPQKVSSNLANIPSTNQIITEPYGVVLVIAPWNFPYGLSIEPVIGAVAAGNAVMIKPSEMAPFTSALLKRLVEQYLDSSALKVVEGGIPETTALLEQPWDKILYTGSPAVGRIVAAAAAKHLTPVTLELGGKNPCFVDVDVDLEVTARRIAHGRFFNGGQSCVAPDFVLADASIASKLVARIQQLVVEWYGTDPSQTTDLSHIVNARNLKRLTGYLEHPGTAASLVMGGQFDESKLYLAPTILQNVPWDAPIMQEEVFGPILVVQTVADFEEVLQRFSRMPKPLSLYVFSRSKAFQSRVLERISSGNVCVNDCLMQFSNRELPFGGVGESGTGAYHGRHSYDCFSHHRAVMVKGFGMDVAARFPPYTRYKDRFMRLLFGGDFVGLLLLVLGLRK